MSPKDRITRYMQEATQTELEVHPLIGPIRARKIVTLRKIGDKASMDEIRDIVSIKGIGEETKDMAGESIFSLLEAWERKHGYEM